MADADLEKLRKICLELPGTKETLTWGHPNFRVGDKIFASYGDNEDGSGAKSYSFKAEKTLQAALCSSDPKRFAPSHYVGQHGWTTVKIAKKTDWAEVEMFVLGSYRLIAPKKLVKALDREEEHAEAVAVKKPKVAKKAAATKK